MDDLIAIAVSALQRRLSLKRSDTDVVDPQSPPRREPTASTLLLSALFLPWLIFVLTIIALNLGLVIVVGASALELQFLRQDLPVLMLTLVVFACLRLAPVPASAGAARIALRPALVAGALALMVVAIGAAGWSLVYLRHPLSLDEFMATFDADAISRGYAAAPIPAAWRPFASALQPEFMFIWPGGARWTSDYLPVNAAARALFGLFGADALENPILSGLSVVCIFAIARWLWPNRPDAALVAAILLATSSQLLVTAMSPYAMPGHLALNLVWLWLVLRDRRWSDAAAIGVAFAACGLHQVVFHPLFAAPFVLQMWGARRWGRAAAFTAAYAVIAGFWIDYQGLLLHLSRVVASIPSAGPPTNALGFFNQVVDLVLARNVDRLGAMSRNALRFISWQNPLTIALGLIALMPGWRQGGVLRALIGGLGLTLAVVTVVMPFQGHGWGYRYLHGELGSLCLIAALGWVRLTSESGPQPWPRPAAWAGLIACSVISLVVLLPWRSVQARQFIAPFAKSQAAIERTNADVVLIDTDKTYFAADLVRNSPFLTNRPKIMNLIALTTDQIEQLCKHQTVAIFDATDATALGVPFDPLGKWIGVNPRIADRLKDSNILISLRQAVRERCGDRHVARFTSP